MRQRSTQRQQRRSCPGRRTAPAQDRPAETNPGQRPRNPRRHRAVDEPNPGPEPFRAPIIVSEATDEKKERLRALFLLLLIVLLIDYLPYCSILESERQVSPGVASCRLPPAFASTSSASQTASNPSRFFNAHSACRATPSLVAAPEHGPFFTVILRPRNEYSREITMLLEN